MLRADQVELLRWAIGLSDLDGSPRSSRHADSAVVELPAALANVDRAALWASGLTAYVYHLIGRRNRHDDEPLAIDLARYLSGQHAEVVARSQRFREATVDLLRRCEAAGVRPAMVKGFTLSDGVWPAANLRPMADIDLVVRPDELARVREVCEANRMRRLQTNAHETVYQLWADRSDPHALGESRDHQGKLEIHTRWGQMLHGYALDLEVLGDRVNASTFAGHAIGMLDHVGVAMHTLCHLSAAVIRREVRPVQVLDTLFALRALDERAEVDFVSFAARVDPRCTAPGLWLCAAFVDTVSLRRLSQAETARLTASKRRVLSGVTAVDVMRDPAANYPLWWRFAWTRHPGEAGRVLLEGIGHRRALRRTNARRAPAAPPAPSAPFVAGATEVRHIERSQQEVP